MNYKFIILFLFLALYFIFLRYPILENKGVIFYNSQDKLWSHRVLDTNLLVNISEEFNGVELDVFYNLDRNLFDVKYHDDDSKITLDNYLNSCEDLKLKFWVDFKNLNQKNVNPSIQLLNTLTKKYNLKAEMIIESNEIELLSKFKEEGFYTSYWLPNYHFFNSILNINKIKRNILNYEPSVISMPYSSVWFYSRKFPNYPIHCWTNDMVTDNDKEKIKNLSEKDNVKVILTDFKNNFLK